MEVSSLVILCILEALSHQGVMVHVWYQIKQSVVMRSPVYFVVAISESIEFLLDTVEYLLLFFDQTIHTTVILMCSWRKKYYSRAKTPSVHKDYFSFPKNVAASAANFGTKVRLRRPEAAKRDRQNWG